MSSSDIGKLHHTDQKVDYLKLDKQFNETMDKIKMQETEQVKQPQDKLEVNVQLSTAIEEVREYLDDPENLLAQNPKGMLYRMKLKVTLSYK